MEDVARYVGFGLDGIEVYYAKHREEQVEYYKGLALNYKLMITGGSDFHGGEDYLLTRLRLFNFMSDNNSTLNIICKYD